MGVRKHHVILKNNTDLILNSLCAEILNFSNYIVLYSKHVLNIISRVNDLEEVYVINTKGNQNTFVHV